MWGKYLPPKAVVKKIEKKLAKLFSFQISYIYVFWSGGGGLFFTPRSRVKKIKFKVKVSHLKMNFRSIPQIGPRYWGFKVILTLTDINLIKRNMIKNNISKEKKKYFYVN